mgnify:CR=1 FL=1
MDTAELLTLLSTVEQAGRALRDGNIGEASEALDDAEQTLLDAVYGSPASER